MSFCKWFIYRVSVMKYPTTNGLWNDVYEGRLQSSWTQIITPSRNFAEMRWWSLFEVHPLESGALLTTLHPLFENVLQTVCRKLQEDSGTGSFDLLIWLEKSRNHMGRDVDCIADVLIGDDGCLRNIRPMRFLCFSNQIKRSKPILLSFWEAKSHGPETPCLLWSRKVHYLFHKSPQHVFYYSLYLILVVMFGNEPGTFWILTG
jgi:hypothetical protein